jgi:pyrroloquinoline quinone biosynthesis protein B
MMRRSLFLFLMLLASCNDDKKTIPEQKTELSNLPETSVVILGTFQDAGSPHIACKKECCEDLFENPDPLRKVVSLGIIDPQNQKTFLFEATPDISSQVKQLKLFSALEKELPDGIFLTHAHIGHYTGLMYLGKEATNAANIPVFAMPRLRQFLATNGPWSQLVSQNNISLQELEDQKEMRLTPNVSVVPFSVPHRDEYSETVGYIITGPSKKVLFIPDIDKWAKWETPIVEAISKVDYAFLDATFYSGDELNTREITEIPHPFIEESMMLFKNLPASEKQKIHFIHFNHTNPVIDSDSNAYKAVIRNGFHVAKINSRFSL